MLQEFLQYLATVRRFSPLTVQNYRRDVTNFLEWLDVPEADFDPRRITVEDVREWIVHRTETKHLGAASMNRELSSLRSFFRYLHRTGRIDKEVMYRIHALKTSRRIPAFVPSTRMEGILDELDRFLMQFQADILDKPVRRPMIRETTALEIGRAHV